MNTAEIRTSLEQRIAASEARIERLQNSSEDAWLESGHYIQQDIYAEQEYCSALYEKLNSLAHTTTQA
jgi:hypothetical protein